MRLFILGDTHGNTGWATERVKLAAELGADWIVQCGDFGIWPGPEGDKFLRKLNQALVDVSLNLFFVDGNHEDFPKLEKLTKNSPVSEEGFRWLELPNGSGTDALNIHHIPRGTAWEWGGVKFGGLGGAVSIDKQWRTPGKSWWPQERITDEDMQHALASFATGIDVLFTHDCPTNVPFVGMKSDLDSHANRQLVSNVAALAQPKLWFHGHMHRAMEYEFGYPPDRTIVYGLDCDTKPTKQALTTQQDWAVLDLPSLKVMTATEYYWLQEAY